MKPIYWLTLVLVTVALAGFGAVLLFGGSPKYQNMTGPVAIVRVDKIPKHGLLGVQFTTTAAGAPLTIANVLPGGGSADAGLQAGDRILLAGSAQRPDFDALENALQNTAPGDEFPVRVIRGAEQLDVRVRLISFEEAVQRAPPASRPTD